MEHKLIQGGEQYLPFARSRVKALRAMGLAYASQKFEVDGCTVTVRIDPNHEYITINGGGILTSMDSGIVDLALPLATPYARVTLYDSDYSLTYRGRYTMPTKVQNRVTNEQEDYLIVDPASGYKYDLSTQLMGEARYTPPNAQGRIRVASLEVGSFGHPKKKVTAGDGTESWVEDTTNDAPVSKKLLANEVPASMYTGRMRLWIQALYGAYLFDYPNGATLPFAPLSRASTPIPMLTVRAYAPPGGTTSYPDVILGLSSGLYLDGSQQHWLITFDGNGTTITFYPLRSTMDAYRSRLAGLSGPAREKLETYILASSLPDVKNKIVTAVADLPPSVSMGYGWHWNWSGTAADIVTIDVMQVNAGDVMTEYYTNMSSHFRINVTWVVDAEGNTRPSVQVEALRSNVVWNVDRTNTVFAAPDWSTGGFEKLTVPSRVTRGIMPSVSDAPIYAYYHKDELKLFSMSMVTTDAPPPKLKYSPADTYPMFGAHWWNNLFDGSFQSFGMNPGSASYYAPMPTGAEHTISMKLGDASDSIYSSGPQENYWTWEMSKSGYSVDRSGDDSNPPAYQRVLVSYHTDGSAGVRGKSPHIFLLIPKGDAEAVYYWSRQVTTDIETDHRIRDGQTWGYATAFSGDGYAPHWQYHYSQDSGYTWIIGGTVTDIDPTTRTTTTDGSIGLYVAGSTLSPTFAVTGDMFRDLADTIADLSFEVRSSATTEHSRVVFCTGRMAPFNASTQPATSCIVGWT